MLSEKHLELLTAYIDGELNGRERRQVARLLRKSPAARKMLADLEKDSRQLTALPRKVPPRELPRRVLRQTAQVELPVVPPPVPATPSTLAPAASGGPSWVGLAAAAVILIAIVAVSYWFFSGKIAFPGQTDTFVEAPPPGVLPPDQGSSKPQDPPRVENPEKVKVDSPKKTEPKVQPPAPLKKTEPLPAPPKKVEPAPRWQFALLDFGKKKNIRDRLSTELGKETAVEFGLTTKNNGQAVQNLEKALKVNGVKLFVDAPVREAVKQGKKMRYLLYAEDLPGAQVAAILDELARTQKPAAPIVQTVGVHSVTAHRRTELARLLGLKPDQMKPAKKTSTAALTLPPPVELTIITDPKHQTNPAPTTPKTAKQPERFALLVAFDPEATPAPLSAEVKNYLKKRQPTRPDNTLQLVIVLTELPM